MKIKNLTLFYITLIFIISLISAPTFDGGIPGGFSGGNYRVFGNSVNPQFSQPGFYGGYGFNPRDYWTNFDKADCREREDMILIIPPGGCSPSVIRSDLLEERNVPVFCKITSIQMNPLIDVTKIRSIRFNKNEGRNFQVSYFPARAAVRSGKNVEASPIIDNVGYLVITIPRYTTEAEMPDFIEGNLTATIDYETDGVFGVGAHDFFLTETTDQEWSRTYKEHGFWKGKGFVRVESLTENNARISIYKDATHIETSITLREGETSRDVYLDGYYCAAGLNIQLVDISYPTDTALLTIDDEEVWVSEGSRFLDNQCRIRSIILGDLGGGTIKVYCTGAGNFELILESSSITLEVDREENEYSIGDLIKTSNKDNLYVGYIGKSPVGDGNFVVLVRSLDEKETFLGRGIGSRLSSETRRYRDSSEFVRTAIQASNYNILTAGLGFARDIVVSEEGEYYLHIHQLLNKQYGIDFKDSKILIGPNSKTWQTDGFNDEWEDEKIKFKGIKSGEVFVESNENLKDNYQNAVDNYNDVFELYPNEKRIVDSDNFETYSEKSLYKAATLSGDLGLKTEKIKYLETIIENYPDSSLANTADNELRNIYSNRNTEDSQAIVYVTNEPHFFSLRRFDKPSFEDLGASLIFTVDGIQYDQIDLEMDRTIKIPKTKIPLEIYEINEEIVEIRYDSKTNLLGAATNYFIGKNVIENREKLEIGKTYQLNAKESISVRVQKINLNRQAQVKILPRTFGLRTKSSINFKIGIEKRGIKLSPEKTKDMIENLDKNIEKWDNINKKLTSVVEGLKGACFATSAMLTVKNLVNGHSGKSMARNDVMTSQGGWNEKCRKWSGENAQQDSKGNTYKTVASCLIAHDKEIDASVKKLADFYDSENKAIKELQEGAKTSGNAPFGLEDSIDQKELKEAYCKSLTSIDKNQQIKITGINRVLVGPDGIYSKSQWKECNIDLDELKLLKMSQLVRDDDVLSEVFKNKLESELTRTYEINSRSREDDILAKQLPKITPLRTAALGTKVIQQPMSEVSNAPKIVLNKLKQNSAITKIISTRDRGNNIIIGLSRTSNNNYKAEAAYKTNGEDYIWIPGGNDVNGDPIKLDIFDKYGNTEFSEITSGYYKNTINKNDLVIKFYERAPYKGLPALVPFDAQNGWYVATDYILSGFGRPYEDNGRAINFWICNVGKNNLIEYKQGDDCRYYNLGSSADIEFPGLSQSESSRLVRDAQKALTQAARQHGKSRITINVRDTIIMKGELAENGDTGRCTDFMSPSDCNLMFNVCDPVICPASRCDFGGQFRVSNVIQSGIIGSLLLCLPNAKEGIKVPICLTGVNAGVENYVSIMRSTQACLQESLDTGRNIGICDEIKSVYMCEFFWDQAAPLMDVVLPKALDFVLGGGQGIRGGGEYLTVNSAWENAKASVDFFKNEYAVNSIKAFNQRSTAEIGGEVCKSFVSTKYPASTDFFDNLIQADSPVQYSAWFSENVLNEATIPPTSHYKVYYHIYAGKDIGAHYIIYLKSPPDSNYVYTIGRYTVDRGYIERGQEVDIARDITGVAGYKELCVSINGQEECGFKSVSTSFALDFLSGEFSKDQASNTNIKKSQDCVAGTPSLKSFLQPNLQAGAGEALNPELYKRGIIRVCSTNNPGKQVENPTQNSDLDRWKRVGYCDSEEISCWLDTDSVKDVLRDSPLLENQALGAVNLSYIDVDGGIPEDEVKVTLSNGDTLKTTDKLELDNNDELVISNLIEVTQRGGTNNFKANAFYIIGQIYDKITKNIYNAIKVKKIQDPKGEDTNIGESETEETNQDGKDDEIEKQTTSQTESSINNNPLISYPRKDLTYDSNVKINDIFIYWDNTLERTYYIKYIGNWKYTKDLGNIISSNSEVWLNIIDQEDIKFISGMDFTSGTRTLADFSYEEIKIMYFDISEEKDPNSPKIKEDIEISNKLQISDFNNNDIKKADVIKITTSLGIVDLYLNFDKIENRWKFTHTKRNIIIDNPNHWLNVIKSNEKDIREIGKLNFKDGIDHIINLDRVEKEISLIGYYENPIKFGNKIRANSNLDPTPINYLIPIIPKGSKPYLDELNKNSFNEESLLVFKDKGNKDTYLIFNGKWEYKIEDGGNEWQSIIEHSQLSFLDGSDKDIGLTLIIDYLRDNIVIEKSIKIYKNYFN